MKQKFFIVFLLIFCSFFAGCKTIPKDLSECVYIMIYDYDNNALKDVQLYNGEKLLGKTDIYGRYSLELNKKESMKITFFKPGYEKILVEVSNQINQVLYVKLGSGIYYSNLSEKSLDDEQYDEALFYIEKALECENRADYVYLKSIIIQRRTNE